jgi:hypothetical protein
VLELQRVRVGNLLVNGLEVGTVRELTDHELAGLRQLVGMVANTPKIRTSPPPAPRPRSRRPSSDRPQNPRSAAQSGESTGSRSAARPRRNAGPPTSGPRRNDYRGR